MGGCERATLPAAPARGRLEVHALLPAGLAPLCSSPAAPGPLGNWGRGEQMFVIREQLVPEHGNRSGREAARLRGLAPRGSEQDRPLAHASRMRFVPGPF